MLVCFPMFLNTEGWKDPVDGAFFLTLFSAENNRIGESSVVLRPEECIFTVLDTLRWL